MAKQNVVSIPSILSTSSMQFLPFDRQNYRHWQNTLRTAYTHGAFWVAVTYLERTYSMVLATRILMGIMLALCVVPAWGLESGAGKVEITPPVGTPLGGDVSRMGRGSTSVHDPLHARAVYISDGATPVFWATVDVCMVGEDLRRRVLELAPKEVPADNIILTATHTHNGAGAMMRPLWWRAASGRFIPEVLEQTAKGLADAMRAAYDNRKPACIGYAVTEQADLSLNRAVENGPRDPQLGIIRIEDADGNPIAIIANLAAHPTTAGEADKYALSADFPGYFCQNLEQLAPGCVALFTPGATGNQRPANPENVTGWAWTESLGRLLAARVNDLASRTTCGDIKLHVGVKSVALPRTMAAGFFPEQAPLQTLELGDLLLTFFPGEACVELGNELRQLALDAGYAAQFSVNVTNGYLGYFAPRDYYGRPFYEARMTFYGPGTADWLCREFRALFSRGNAPVETPAVETPAVQEVEGIKRLLLTGTWNDIGVQRGRLFGDAIRQRYEAFTLAPVQSGTLLPETGWWRTLSRYANVTPYALTALGITARGYLQGLSNNMISGLEGLAAGAEMPFDAAWLVQAGPAMSLAPKFEAFFQVPFCTTVASVGDRAGVDGAFVGRVFDWQEAGPDGAPMPPGDIIVVEERPARGRAVLMPQFPWSTGTFSGMNEQGLVVCAERAPELGTPRIVAAPVEFVLRDLLQQADTAGRALALLQMQGHLRGYRILIADSATPEAYVVDCGSGMSIRRPEKGLLFARNPEDPAVPDIDRARYLPLVKSLRVEHVVGSARLRAALIDQSPPQPIWNGLTRYAVVFEPRAGALRICLPRPDGTPGDYVRVTFTGAAS